MKKNAVKTKRAFMQKNKFSSVKYRSKYYKEISENICMECQELGQRIMDNMDSRKTERKKGEIFKFDKRTGC